MSSKQILILAHNIRSLWNVGTLFRNADCFGVEKLYLSGYTGLPPRREISKTALGADEWIKWEGVKDPIKLMNDLRKKGWRIVALELTDKAVNVNDYKAPEKILLVVGHEVSGVPKEHLKVCDDHIFIPMQGKKSSLNVAVATGVALSVLSRH